MKNITFEKRLKLWRGWKNYTLNFVELIEALLNILTFDIFLINLYVPTMERHMKQEFNFYRKWNK